MEQSRRWSRGDHRSEQPTVERHLRGLRDAGKAQQHDDRIDDVIGLPERIGRNAELYQLV
jgi:hypothetical protein